MRSKRRTRKRQLQRGQQGGWLFGGNNSNNSSNKDGPLCQCPVGENEKPCGQPAIPKTLFCENHQNCKPPPLSNEGPYDPAPYKPRSVRLSHNCLMYAIGHIDPKAVRTCNKSRKNCRDRFRQPGDVTNARNGLTKDTRLTCDKVEEMFLNDYPEAKKSTFYKPCPPGYRKIAGIVDARNDHHWLKQHKDRKWSHKSGELEVGQVDAQDQPIFFPKPGAADFNYTKHKNSNLNYEDFCGFYCVPVAPGEQDVWVEEGEKEANRSLLQQRRKGRKERQTRRKE